MKTIWKTVVVEWRMKSHDLLIHNRKVLIFLSLFGMVRGSLLIHSKQSSEGLENIPKE